MRGPAKGLVWTGPVPPTLTEVAGPDTGTPYPSAYQHFLNRPWEHYMIGWPGSQPLMSSAAAYWTMPDRVRQAYGYAWRSANAQRGGRMTVGLYFGSQIKNPFEHGDTEILDPTLRRHQVALMDYVIGPFEKDFGQDVSEVVFDAGAVADRLAQQQGWKEFLRREGIISRVEAVPVVGFDPDPKWSVALNCMGILFNQAAGGISYSHPNTPGWAVPQGANWCLGQILFAGGAGPEVNVTVQQLVGFILKGWSLWPDFAHDSLVQQAYTLAKVPIQGNE